MAKKFSFAAYDRKHLKNLLRRAKDIGSLFNDAARDGARIGEATGYTDPNGEFAFDNFPSVKQRVDELFKGLHDQLLLTVTDGNREEWLLSAAKNDALIESKYSRAVKKFAERAEAWAEPHLEALEQFNKRKERGMNLSDRVWKLTDQFKGELELALEMGLGDGKSAAALSRDVREYLNEPHKLFRRVRNEKGQFRLSKAAAAYHPGQGVYRSSYKNALRLTATENNIAYRTADHERWNDLDFVIGIEIMLSNNHPVEDICDEMCGLYPKTFKFVGWHPFCRCIAIPKLADEDEFIARQQALIDGEDVPQGGYAEEVTEMPQCFTNWVQDNAERIETAKSTPYFIADNRVAVKQVLHPKAPKPQTTQVEEIVEQLRKPKPAPKPEPAPEPKSEPTLRKGNLYTEEYGEKVLQTFDRVTLRSGQYGTITLEFADEIAYNAGNTAFGNLDLISLNKDIRHTFSKFGVEIKQTTLEIGEDDGDIFIEWKGANASLGRRFSVGRNGKRVVEHEYFALDKELQGKGLSKAIFRDLYKEYRAVGIDQMEVHANIDVGGYTWGRYGFCVSNRDRAIGSINYSALTLEEENQIVALIDNHFATSKAPFCMNEIAKLPFGRKALLGMDWEGALDLTNPELRKYFEHYIKFRN